VPANCALCDSICPTNMGTTIVDGVQALAIDVGNAVRLIDKCFAGLQSCLEPLHFLTCLALFAHSPFAFVPRCVYRRPCRLRLQRDAGFETGMGTLRKDFEQLYYVTMH